MADTCTNCGFQNPPGMRFCGNCGARLPEGSAPVQTTPAYTQQTPERLGAMVGSDLLERFRQAGLEAAGQRRSVTILFADLSGYTSLSTHVDNEDLYEMIQKFTSLMAQDVYKYEGMVDKFTGDGLMALFGAPIAHESNAELAVRAALDMQQDVEKLNQEMQHQLGAKLRLRIGLNHGSVTVGGIGSNLFMNYTAIGDTVNMAQRLQDATQPGTIMVSESVHQQTHMLFEFQPVPGLQLKGIAEPATGYLCQGEKSRPGLVRGIEGLRAPMIGRDLELNALLDNIKALQDQRTNRFALVTGEAGLGKSRLVAELRSCLASELIIIIEGHSLIYRRPVSYWIFLDLLRNYINAPTDAPPQEIQRRLSEKVAQLLGGRAADVLAYLEHMLSLPPSDPVVSQRISYLDASQLRQQIFRAMRDLLLAEAHRQPVLIILEDLHWADDASLDLLSYLLDNTHEAPIFLLGVTRPFQDGPLLKLAELAEATLKDRFINIPLHSLSPDQSKILLQELMAIPNLPETLREQIILRASGIPFYLEEILRTLIDHNLLQRVDGNWNLAPGVDPENLGVPDSLQGLILARFDRTLPAQRHVLQVSSVVGRQFNSNIIQAVIPELIEDQLQSALTALTEREFISQDPELPGVYEFKHVIVSDAIYSTLLKRDRAALHGKVGLALEKFFADQIDNQVDLLARHFSWSNLPEHALYYLILAGEKSAHSYVNDQARKYFEQALDLLPSTPHTPEQALKARLGLGDILVLAGEYTPARLQYQAALEGLDGHQGDDYLRSCCTLQRKIGITFERQGDFKQALLNLAEARQLLGKTSRPDIIELAQMLNDYGWIQFRMGNHTEAEKSLKDALVLSEQTTRYELTASIYNRMGGVYYQLNSLDSARECVQKSLILREKMDDVVAMARTYNNLGLLDWKTGHWDNALRYLRRSLELHANLGDIEGIIDVQGNLGLIQLDRGEIEEARQYLEDTLQKAQQIGHGYIIAMTYLYLCRLCITVEDWQGGLDYGLRGLNTFTEIAAMDRLVDVYTFLGFACLGMNDIEQAEKWSREALNSWNKINQIDPSNAQAAPPASDDRGRALRLAGEVCRMQKDYDQAEVKLRSSLDIFSILGIHLEQGRAIISLARLSADRGNYPQANEFLLQARFTFYQLGAKLDLQKLAMMQAAIQAEQTRK